MIQQFIHMRARHCIQYLSIIVISGEVYEVDDTMLSKLDILEDHPNYYVREIDNIIVKKQ